MNATVSTLPSAPPFELEDVTGRRVRLQDYRGRKVLVALLRNARCAVCNLWVHEASVRTPMWQALGLDVIAIFESSVDKLRAQFTQPAPFAVLADPDGAVHEAFGSKNEPSTIAEIMASGSAEPALRRAAEAGFIPTMEEGGNFNRIPAEVMVREDGRILHVHHATNVVNHMSVEMIEQLLGVGSMPRD